MHAVILMFELYFHLFSSFQDPDAIKCNPRFQSLRALANPWAVGHPLIPSYTCPLMWAPSYIYPLMPSYTYLLIHPLTHTLLCMCIFSIGLQNHWAPSYTVLCMCRFCLLANPWAAYYFIYPSLAWGFSYYCRCIYVY